MVIFGAGASYDSCPTYPPGSPVKWGKELEEEAKTYPRAMQELASIKCYLQTVIFGAELRWNGVAYEVSNYVSLLREIQRLRKNEELVCLVTLNYDTLLETAVAQIERKIESINDCTKPSAVFRVFKLHGSVNWGRCINTRLPPNINTGDGGSVLRYLIDHVEELSAISKDFVIADPANMGASVDGRPVFPAIAIPVEKKSSFECPETMLNELKSLLPKVTRGLIIGWRATEEHFFEILREHLTGKPFFAVVGGSQEDATEIRDRIHKEMSGNPLSISPVQSLGFTDFMLRGACVHILRNF